MKYDIIVADYPWKFSSNSKAKPGKNAMAQYPCMTDDEIVAMPPPGARTALLFLWTTAPMLQRTFRIIDRWNEGLRPRWKYVTELTWPKNTISHGFWARGQHEPVLILKRSNFPCPFPAPFPSSLIKGKRRAHSQKPEWLQDQIDRNWPDASKLEMFSRTSRPGWDAFGNEVGKFDTEKEPTA